jgi:hypothetical protein
LTQTHNKSLKTKQTSKVVVLQVAFQRHTEVKNTKKIPSHPHGEGKQKNGRDKIVDVGTLNATMGFDRLNRIADSVTDVNSRLVRTVSQSTDVDGGIRPVSTPSSLSLFFSHAQALSSAGFNALSNATISFLPSSQIRPPLSSQYILSAPPCPSRVLFRLCVVRPSLFYI